jgi:hypothetical protein
MFPFSFEGTIDVPSDGSDAALDRIKIAIMAVRAKAVERRRETLVFRGGVFRMVSSWNVLCPVDECKVSNKLGKLLYICSTKELFAASTGMAIILWAFIHFVGGETVPVFAQFAVPATGWLWLFGMNYITARFRLRKFLARAARGA